MLQDIGKEYDILVLLLCRKTQINHSLPCTALRYKQAFVATR